MSLLFCYVEQCCFCCWSMWNDNVHRIELEAKTEGGAIVACNYEKTTTKKENEEIDRCQLFANSNTLTPPKTKPKKGKKAHNSYNNITAINKLQISSRENTNTSTKQKSLAESVLSRISFAFLECRSVLSGDSNLYKTEIYFEKSKSKRNTKQKWLRSRRNVCCRPTKCEQ